VVVLAGKDPRGWKTGKAQAFDAFDAKAEALALLAEAGAPVDNLQVMGEAGRSSSGPVGHAAIGAEDGAGALRHAAPATAKAFDLDGPVAAVELFLDRIPRRRPRPAPGRTMRRPRCRR
jgi:phenylalanyl-tRNA synthetase beta chain